MINYQAYTYFAYHARSLYITGTHYISLNDFASIMKEVQISHEYYSSKTFTFPHFCCILLHISGRYSAETQNLWNLSLSNKNNLLHVKILDNRTSKFRGNIYHNHDTGHFFS